MIVRRGSFLSILTRSVVSGGSRHSSAGLEFKDYCVRECVCFVPMWRDNNIWFLSARGHDGCKVSKSH